MKGIRAISGLSLTIAMGVVMAANAQTPSNGIELETVSETACIATTPAEQRALNAAKNEARQMAERVNGGLTVYRAEPAMHGAVVNSPCEAVGEGVWRFTFRGGEPVAVSTLGEYAVLSVVTVNSATGRDRKVSLEYNGPIEDYDGPPPIIPQLRAEPPSLADEPQPLRVSENSCTAATPAEQRALNAAKNTARRAAEQANGGLNRYRAEPAMHGDVIDAPCEVVRPGVWRFTFRGGSPEAVSTLGIYTVLSIVDVEGTGGARRFSLEYNGPIEEYTR